jgi:hypothetical protein
MNGLRVRWLIRFAVASLQRAWVIPAVLAFAMQGTPALSQVSAGDAGARAAPSSIPNVPPMGQAAPVGRAPPMSDVGPKGGGRSNGQATRRQCENLLTRAAAVPALRQGEDYEFCMARFPDIRVPGVADTVAPAAAPKQ